MDIITLSFMSIGDCQQGQKKYIYIYSRTRARRMKISLMGDAGGGMATFLTISYVFLYLKLKNFLPNDKISQVTLFFSCRDCWTSSWIQFGWTPTKWIVRINNPWCHSPKPFRRWPVLGNIITSRYKIKRWCCQCCWILAARSAHKVLSWCNLVLLGVINLSLGVFGLGTDYVRAHLHHIWVLH